MTLSQNPSLYVLALLSYEFSTVVKDTRCLILCLFSGISHYRIIFRTGMQILQSSSLTTFGMLIDEVHTIFAPLKLFASNSFRHSAENFGEKHASVKTPQLQYPLSEYPAFQSLKHETAHKMLKIL